MQAELESIREMTPQIEEHIKVAQQNIVINRAKFPKLHKTFVLKMITISIEEFRIRQQVCTIYSLNSMFLIPNYGSNKYFRELIWNARMYHKI